MKKIIIILAMVLAGVAMYAQEPQVLVRTNTETSSSTLPRRSAMPERNSPRNR